MRDSGSETGVWIIRGEKVILQQETAWNWNIFAVSDDRRWHLLPCSPEIKWEQKCLDWELFFPAPEEVNNTALQPIVWCYNFNVSFPHCLQSVSISLTCYPEVLCDKWLWLIAVSHSYKLIDQSVHIIPLYIEHVLAFFHAVCLSSAQTEPWNRMSIWKSFALNMLGAACADIYDQRIAKQRNSCKKSDAVKISLDKKEHTASQIPGFESKRV